MFGEGGGVFLFFFVLMGESLGGLWLGRFTPFHELEIKGCLLFVFIFVF